LRIFTDPSLVEHVNHSSGVERPERLDAALSGVWAAGRAGIGLEYPAFEAASRELLETVHDPGYLKLLEAVSGAGGGYLDPDTSMNERSWEVVRRASGAAAGAAESALAGTSAFAVVRPPGHHAACDRAMGFCYLNHAAVAAARALELGARRVAILDWDVHHGNGTQEIFYSTDRVLYLSVHRSPFYPGTGAAEEVGAGAGEGHTVNVPLPGRSGLPAYAAAFAGVLLPVLREYSPELVIVSAGYDAHRDDPLGGMELAAPAFRELAAALAADHAPLALVLEGGYDPEGLAAGVRETILGVASGSPPDWGGYGYPEPVRRARRILSQYWASLR
jgi:acetoin utilization deacetylase AcuC-like enzyme